MEKRETEIKRETNWTKEDMKQFFSLLLSTLQKILSKKVSSLSLSLSLSFRKTLDMNRAYFPLRCLLILIIDVLHLLFCFLSPGEKNFSSESTSQFSSSSHCKIFFFSNSIMLNDASLGGNQVFISCASN